MVIYNGLGGVDPRYARCVGAIHWPSRRDLETGQAAPPAFLFRPWMLCPEPASVLAVNWRAGGICIGKITP